MLKLKIDCPKGCEPVRSSEGAAGYDLKTKEDFFLNPKCRKIIRTGLKIQLPKGHFAKICGRSGMWFKDNISIGQEGTIDEDYTGEIKIILVNNSHEVKRFSKFERIAQMIIQKYEVCEISKEPFTDTLRGENGFGHTGK